MSDELCEMSLQQTQELLRLTDLTLQNICCKRFTGEELYVEVLGKILGGRGKRGPACIFMGFQDNDGSLRHGRVFHLKDGTLVERSDEIVIDPLSSNTAIFSHAQSQDNVVAVNWADCCASVEDFQAFFHPAITSFLAAPITNFVANRISGESPGTIIAFNYPGHATNYDADVLRSLAVVIGSLLTLSDEVKATEKAFIYTIEALARACEAAEEDTGRHILRVNRFAGALAANLGLPNDYVEAVSYSAQMHDVGKIGRRRSDLGGIAKRAIAPQRNVDAM